MPSVKRPWVGDPRLASDFPWVTRYHVDISEEHFDLARTALKGIADILGPNLRLLEWMTIFTQGKALKYPSNSGLVLEFELTQQDGIERKGMRDALIAFFKPIRDESLERGKIGKIVEDDAPSLDDLLDPASVLVMSNGSLSRLKALQNGSDREDRTRYKDLVDRIEEGGQRKPLATLARDQVDSLVSTSSFPHFSELFDFLTLQFRLAMLDKSVLRLPPVLIVGDPGIGKTEFLITLAESFGTDFLPFDMASIGHGRGLCGVDAAWSNAQTGQLFDVLMFGRTANPVVFLDEIDKVRESRHSSPIGPLFSLLERRTAQKFSDQSTPGVVVDASHVVWFAAANDENSIDPAILSRFKVFHIPSPTREQLPAIARSIYRSLISSEGWGRRFARDLREEVATLFSDVSAREVRRILELACARAASHNRFDLTVEDIVMLDAGRAHRSIGF